MRYLGGKHAISKDIAPIVARSLVSGKARAWWDPFCGGLSMAARLAEFGPGIVSDINRPLIALYRAMLSGWTPPVSVSEAEYKAARTLPDDDPMKAFVGIGCSFAGKWFGGYARPHPSNKDPMGASRKALLRDIPKLANCKILSVDFLRVRPRKAPLVIYADPPYHGVTGYDFAGPFDTDAFWRRCQEWERYGVPVFVSEYSCPVPNVLLWERAHYRALRKRGGTSHVDKLFRVHAVRRKFVHENGYSARVE